MTDNRIQHQHDDAATGKQQSPASNKSTALTRAEQDQLDREMYALVRRDGIPFRQMAHYLGWSKRKAERIRQQLHRLKAGNNTPREHVRGNIRLGSPPEALWFPQFPQRADGACLQLLNSGATIDGMTQNLSAKLEDANRRLTQLILDGTACDVLITELTPVAAKAEAAAQCERETALIESRPEKENVIRAALVAQKKLDDATAKTRTITGAIERQKEAITAIQADIVANRDGNFLRELQELRLREKLLRKIGEVAETLYEINTLGGKHNVCGIWLMNPPPVYQYPDTRAMHYCDALNMLVGAVMNFSQKQSLMDKAA